MDNLLIFGGTFDPIHFGHLNVAVNVQKIINFQRFIFLPCKVPLLKDPATASSRQRLKMLEIALDDYPEHLNFEIDSREVLRQSPSYMSVTLESYRQEVGKQISITLLMGIDSFNQLPQWHNWTSLLDLCNILVLKRPLTKISSQELVYFLSRHQTTTESNLPRTAHGLIHLFNAGSYELSSSLIRNKLRDKTEIKNAIPASVLNYILKEGLYKN